MTNERDGDDRGLPRAYRIPAAQRADFFREALRADRCWDAEVQQCFERCGEPLCDCILQNREELIGLCEFIAAHRVRSYLEIGIWTGRLLCAMQRLFDFEVVGACDHGWAQRLGLPLHLPSAARLFSGDSGSPAFRTWRSALGHIDLVLIDADHSYRAVRRDFDINRSFAHRFIAVHDITGATRQTVGVGRFWQQLDQGSKREVILPHRELGLGHSTMGIGIWSSACPVA